ncbi:hypothetical protein [Elioraea rosea]|uniref:hypothetical protein n=1 Tax=Elioraea rosea TaxID=2492390 RepID=UPI001184C7CE|nr:hypothetical protein [Elioraea rosea]
MQNAPSPQKAGRDGRLSALGAASFLALAPLVTSPARAEADADTSPGGERFDASALTLPPWPLEAGELHEMAGFVTASAEVNWTPAAEQTTPPAPPGPPQPPLGARNSEAAPDSPAGSGDDGPGATAGRANNLVVGPREQDLASLPFPPFVVGTNNPGGAGQGGFGGGPTSPGPTGPGPTDPGPEPDPVPTLFFGTSSEGIIATLTVTRRVAPSWVVEAVADDPSSVQVIAPTTASLPGPGSTRQVSIAWADLDGDGLRDGHLYRIDNAGALAVTLEVQIVGGADLPGSAMVDANSSAFVWVPLSAAATVRFSGTDASGDPIAWLRDVNTQNTTDMRTTTVTRAAWVGEMHEATEGEDVFHFGPGQGVDGIRLYDPGQDSILLDAGTAARVVDIAGTTGLLVGPTNREGIVLDGIAYNPALTLTDLNVLFA